MSDEQQQTFALYGVTAMIIALLIAPAFFANAV